MFKFQEIQSIIIDVLVHENNSMSQKQIADLFKKAGCTLAVVDEKNIFMCLLDSSFEGEIDISRSYLTKVLSKIIEQFQINNIYGNIIDISYFNGKEKVS